ncbi:hypothetical protein J437_LFUL014261 [Ladona fulva]|uniref:Uncharacterized protein n=1 Tax=Ladona fulva TaxID=123851 RepID=A0A8K0KHE6_LADFU|nr:hypothetical protein J437_LFUL014261 [Ladona fulva]
MKIINPSQDTMEPTMDPKLVAQSLNFHGQQLQKIWEGEKEGELAKLNVTDLDFAVYQERQKQLSFQDRAKRLKLQQFVVKKANVLFDSSQVDVHHFGGHSSTGGGEEDFYAILPPYETFLHVDKATRVRQFFQASAHLFY